MPQPTLADKLTEAQREADALNEQLAKAQSALNAALAAEDYPEADRHKQKADALREPVLVANAHVAALTAGAQELQRQQQADQRAAQEREQREQAKGLFEDAQHREAEAEDEVGQCLAELAAAWGALHRVMDAAFAAEQRQRQARLDGWQTGVAAGVWHPEMPRPALPNRVQALIEHSPLLTQVRRTPQLPR